MDIQPPVEFTLIDLLKNTLKVYRVNFKVLAQLAVVSILPRFLYNLLLVLPFGITVINGIDNLVDLLLSLWTYIAFLGVILISERAVQDNSVLSFKQAFRFGLAKWGSLVTTMLVFIFQIMLIGIPISLAIKSNSVILSVLVGMIGLILIILLLGFYQFFAQIVALRGIVNNKALRRSSWIVKGQWWQAFGFFLVILLPIKLISLGTYYLMKWIIPDLLALRVILSSAVSVFILPVSTIYQTLLFLSLEARKGEAPTFFPTEPQP